jgi:hydroxymethylglutaryl-CoA reductase
VSKSSWTSFSGGANECAAAGLPEPEFSEIVAAAVEEGIMELYCKQIADAYLSGDLDRAQAVAELGEERVEDLDYARRAIEEDVKWGLRGE